MSVITIVLLGLSFIIQAILHGFGCPYLVSKKYRNNENRKEYQKGLVFPLAFLGVGWLVLGLMFPTFHEQDSYLFCVGLIAIAVIPLFLVRKNSKKFKK